MCGSELVEEALHIGAAGSLYAIRVQLATLPVIEGEAAGIGDSFLGLSHFQAAEATGKVIILTIAALVLHLRQLVRVNKRCRSRGEELRAAHLLHSAGAEHQRSHQNRNQFLHTRGVIP